MSSNLTLEQDIAKIKKDYATSLQKLDDILKNCSILTILPNLELKIKNLEDCCKNQNNNNNNNFNFNLNQSKLDNAILDIKDLKESVKIILTVILKNCKEEYVSPCQRN
jgi:hypothetical protein